MIPRTDLAAEWSGQHALDTMPGVRLEEMRTGDIVSQCLTVETEDAASRLGREMGRYFTISLPGLDEGLQDADEVTAALVEILQQVIPPQGTVLVAGLGNRAMTPDALGPCAADRVLATRHLPEDFYMALGLTFPLRDVCTLQPGVLASTGMESAAVVSAVAQKANAKCIVAIDAMAAAHWSRLGTTIQVSDAGIAPGSGVHNARQPLSQKILGVPVIAVGIPTVVDAPSLTATLFPEGQSALPQEAKRLTVTPRTIDAIIQRGAYAISLALNRVLHPQLSTEEILYLLS